MQLMLVLLIVIVFAYILSELCRYLNIPRVVGQITAGMILAVPYVQSWIFTSESRNMINFLADIGIILLFFFVGLEINISRFRQSMEESLKISLLNTVVPFALGAGISLLLNLNTVASIIVGVALAVSAQAISIDFLEELNMIKSRIGQLIITAGAVDDIVELLFVSIVLAMIHSAVGGTSLLWLIVSIVIFIALVIIAKMYVIPYALTVFEKDHDKTSLFTGAMIITLIMAGLSEKFGLGSLMGALIAGIFVRQILIARGAKVEEEQITSLIHIISFGFLVPIFFVWVGLNTDMGGIVNNFWFTLLITVIAFAGTIGGTIAGVLWSRGTFKEGHIVGWGLNAKGDVELVIASLAFQRGIIDSSLFSSLVFMALVTTLVSPVVFRHLIKRYRQGDTYGGHIQSGQRSTLHTR